MEVSLADSTIKTNAANFRTYEHWRLKSHQPALGPIDYAFWAYLILE